MRLFANSWLVAWLIGFLVYLPVLRAADYLPNTDQSNRLTDYLHNNRLPLVGAQVLTDSAGDRQVLLYGYTATEFGKSDAASKARRFLQDSGISVSNHIRVQPELLTMKSAPNTAPTQPSESSPGTPNGVQNYENQAQSNAEQQYMNQGAPQYMNQSANMAATLLPLIGLGLALGLGSSGIGIGGSGFGSPFGGSGFGGGYGGSGYGPNSYPNPGPYGPGPYGPPPYGSSPYGSSPYGSSPYGYPAPYSSPGYGTYP